MPQRLERCFIVLSAPKAAESRLTGRSPAWSPIGERPLVKVHQRYEWTYLYAFARPKTGEVHWLILPTVNAEAFSVALENFAREVGVGKRKHILLVLDGAGCHKAKKLRRPEGIHLEFLPSYSPELQPSERLWP